MKTRVCIIAPTGYTGYWLIELLLRHPGAQITFLASARGELPVISDEFPSLLKRCDLRCRPIDYAAIAAEADVAFTCLPHKAAMDHVPGLLAAGVKVIDLSADYRLTNAALYEKIYQTPHSDPANLAKAVYGLPELFADRIKSASLIANPGCYPTAAALAISPLLQAGLVKSSGIIINAASGISGAGKAPKPNLHFPEMNEAFVAYSVGEHRHEPEISQTLSTAAGSPIPVLFVPHLLPVDKGILETIYLDPVSDSTTESQLMDCLKSAYADQPFVRVRKELPNIKFVRDTNFCDISLRLRSGKIILCSAIDNMIKGASGQAVQNMNLLFNHPPAAGLI